MLDDAVVVTGASAGIGAELARQLAVPLDGGARGRLLRDRGDDRLPLVRQVTGRR
jgi:NAD(P)-dependent dehydrogenase (short-subunit alcohol dehydrogenase family)